MDKIGENSIMAWLLESFSAEGTVEYLEQTSLEMPRLDAYLSSQLMDPRRRGELGLQFQACAEKVQLRGRAPLRGVLLNMVARRFFFGPESGCESDKAKLVRA